MLSVMPGSWLLYLENTLTKIQWHQFMEITDEQVARELTRIDWIMYSSIRPRDLIRDVSLPAEQKEKCTSLEHVNRMVQHFNHIAYWVANMILLRDKPKHRAKTLEKFMGVAWKLRHLNNYNSLGAVVAGINGTAVHRLTQTRELIRPQSQRIHAPRDTDGNAEKSFRVPIGLFEYFDRANPLSATSPTRSRSR